MALSTLDQTMKDAPIYFVKSRSLQLQADDEKVPFVTLDGVTYIGIRPLQLYVQNQPYVATWQTPGIQPTTLNKSSSYIAGTDIFLNTSEWFNGVIFVSVAKLGLTATVNPDGTLWIEQ